MLTNAYLSIFALAALASPAMGRYVVAEKRHWLLSARRFGQEHPATIDQIAAACNDGTCATLAGQAISTLLAASPECDQQNFADKIIDAANARTDPAETAAMIAAAVAFRQSEKNSPPDFTTNPPTPRNTVFCQTAPKNSQLNGLVQSQDPANGDLFFDPATKASVQRGAQANTFPFGTNGAASNASSAASSGAAASASAPAAVTTSAAAASGTASVCVASTSTVTVTAAATASAAAATNVASTAPVASGSVDFGSCTDPSVKFGAGLDGRKATEFSFLPNNQADFSHGSALNPDIIFQFICDTFVNKCGFKQTDATVTTCRAAQKTADALGKTGAAADSFNGALGITTDFAALDTATASSGAAAVAASTTAAAASVAVSTTAAAAAATTTTAASTAPAASGSVDFGTCTDPSVKFGAGLDGRKATEFSFLPNNQADFSHGSALNPDIIFQFICDTFVNKCGFKQTDATVTTCRSAQATADALGKTGAAADSFNGALGITTDFAALDTATAASSGAAVTASTTVAAAAAASTTAAAASTAGNLQTFTGALGGVVPPTVLQVGTSFQVTGNALFNNKQNAIIRSCDVQHNQCANLANSTGNKAPVTVDACGTQQTACNAAAGQ